MTVRQVKRVTTLGAVLLAVAAGPGWSDDAKAPAAGLEEAVAAVRAHPEGEERARLRARLETLVEQLSQSTAPAPEREAEQRILEEAAAMGLPAAATALGYRLRSQGQMEEAFAWFHKAATAGYPPAMVQTGLMYSNGDGVERDMDKAASWLRPANVKGSATGKFLLAECFLFGKGVERNPEIGLTLLEEAVSVQPTGRALDLLGTCYHKGWGAPPDPLRAVKLYRSACERGFYNAFANLAVLYMRGDGVPADPGLAVDLLREGIDRGQNPLCMYFLGLAHHDGLGVGRSERAAKDWMQRAAEAGNEQARAWLEARGVP